MNSDISVNRASLNMFLATTCIAPYNYEMETCETAVLDDTRYSCGCVLNTLGETNELVYGKNPFQPVPKELSFSSLTCPLINNSIYYGNQIKSTRYCLFHKDMGDRIETMPRNLFGFDTTFSREFKLSVKENLGWIDAISDLSKNPNMKSEVQSEDLTASLIRFPTYPNWITKKIKRYSHLPRRFSMNIPVIASGRDDFILSLKHGIKSPCVGAYWESSLGWASSGESNLVHFHEININKPTTTFAKKGRAKTDQFKLALCYYPHWTVTKGKWIGSITVSDDALETLFISLLLTLLVLFTPAYFHTYITSYELGSKRGSTRVIRENFRFLVPKIELMMSKQISEESSSPESSHLQSEENEINDTDIQGR